jgi:ABC-type uncharacterized transport system permease subunit
MPRPLPSAVGQTIELPTRWHASWGEQALVGLILLIHAWSVAAAVFHDGQVFVGVGVTMSAIVLVTVAIHWFGSFFYNLRGLQLLVFPVAALCSLAPGC